MFLQGKRILLEKLDNIDYVLNLAEIDNKREYSREQIKELFNNPYEFWGIFLKGKIRGVVGWFKIGEVYLMEALKDKSKPATGISYSIEVGELFLNYMFSFTNKVRTCAKIGDKAIQILCLKLGFKELWVKDGLIIYEKER